MENSFIQWNCRGFRNKLEEIQLFIKNHNPIAICLQETLLKDNESLSIKNYTTYNYTPPIANGKVSGGVCILVRNDIPHSEVQIQTPLQAIAVQIATKKKITLCSIYLPPNSDIIDNDLDNLITQLPTPCMLLGDFNAHNKLWGCSHNSSRGNIIEDLIGRHDLCYFNDKSPTHIHAATQTPSAIDLTFCHPSLYLDFNWEVGEDLCGSDHYPIFLHHSLADSGAKIPRWKLHRANWETFQALCLERIHLEDLLTAADPVETFSSKLIKIAEECIPKSSAKPKRPYFPWFNQDCREAIKKRRKALNAFKKSPTQENLITYKQAYARSRRTIRRAKKESWCNYVSKLNTNTSVKQTWNMVRKISGKHASSPTKFLNTPAGTASSKKEIADTLGETFAKNSSTDNYTEEFKKFKSAKEKSPINFASQNTESYNKPLTVEELEVVLGKSKDSTTGPDEIHYQLLKHLPSSCKGTLIELFNNMWEKGSFPPSWREATVIPIPKQGKDNTIPNNYRPIALTSCLCKTFERIVNDRLVWFLEQNHIISKFQAGFRHGRSTNDQLLRLETSIREAFIKQQHLVAIFFDLEKAYDTAWKYGILKDLHDSGLRGYLPTFISNFLQNRNFRVKFGDTFSEKFPQEMGAPQGSILSPTLFNLKINSIVKCVSSDIECSLYVDDFLITCKSTELHSAEQKLQKCLKKLEVWCNENGFKFSPTKTNCVHFTKKRNAALQPNLCLNGQKIPVVAESKFLGVIFDNKLTFIPHIEYLKAKCQKALNLLRVVANMEWGGDREVLLRLYRSLVRSKLDYGSIVYGAARKSYLVKLDPIANQGLRLSLGAFRTSPSVSLHAEAQELPLHLRRQKLGLQYAVRISTNPQNPTYSTIFDGKLGTLFIKNPRAVPPFYIRVRPLLDKINFNNKNMDIYKQKIPPYKMHQPEILFDLSEYKKEGTPPELFMSLVGQVKEKYHNYKYIYTDGSKVDEKVAAAAVTDSEIFMNRLADHSSIFTAEGKAINLALDHIKKTNNTRYLIFSDSLSCLQAFLQASPKNPWVVRVLEKYNQLKSRGKDIVFCWIPSHIGIKGNEEADEAAKEALSLNEASKTIVASDLGNKINDLLQEEWQREWESEPNLNNKLKRVLPKLNKNHTPKGMTRRDGTVCARLRIGHSYLTHCYLLKGEPQPFCVSCNEALTINHLLTNCAEFADSRRKHYSSNTLEEVLTSGNYAHVLSFLKEINLYKKV